MFMLLWISQPWSLSAQRASLQGNKDNFTACFALGLALRQGLLTHSIDLQGMDISEAMLDVALDREVEGDLCVGDLGQGLPFRAGTFDGAISISAVQWLCNAVRTHPIALTLVMPFRSQTNEVCEPAAFRKHASLLVMPLITGAFFVGWTV